MPTPPRQVFIVDDHPVMRDGLKALLGRAPDFEVCGEAVNADETLQALASGMEPDLIVLDLSLPGMSGLDLIKQIRGLRPSLPILILSAHDESVYAERVVRAGAQGYLTKHSASGDILDAVRRVLDGEIVLSDALRKRMVEDAIDGRSGSMPIERLSDREIEVFEHIGHGRSTAAIAQTMCISPKTVESHRLNIKKKLDVDTANQLVQRAAVWVAKSGVPSPKVDARSA